MVEFGSLPAARNETRFTKNPSRYVPIPGNARRMRTELTERYRRAEELLQASGFFPRSGGGRRGIIAGGVAYAYASQVIEDLGLQNDVTLLQIGAYPIPEKLLLDFLGSVESVLVVEELTPFIEEWVGLCALRNGLQIPIFGKHSGHFPVEFEYSPDLVEDAVRSYLKLEQREKPSVAVPELPPRPPVLCPGCPHRASLYMVKKVFGKRTIYCNDIGCYTLGYGAPLHVCDVLLCMGSSITQASGIARVTGRRTVACLGDSTFFHSGLPALVNAVQARDQVTVVILDNYITAMTGFQPSLTTECLDSKKEAQPGSGTSDNQLNGHAIEDAVRGLHVHDVYSVDPFDEKATLAALKRAKNGVGVNVVICHAPCVVHQRKVNRAVQRPPLVIDQEQCDGCSLCVRVLGCPAVLVADGKYTIDQELCIGCELCVRVCQHDAIQPAALEKV